MQKSLVTFIIPTYNRAKIIGETLHSIQAQTYPIWECLVVDDGSTDNTERVLANFSGEDSRIKYLKRPEDRKRGGNAARNFGFENSKGEFINFVDSDDLLHQRKLELQLQVLHNQPDCQVCLSEAEIFSETKRYKKQSKDLGDINFFEDYILRKIDMGTTQPLWRKTFLAAASMVYDENLKRAQDFDFLSRMSFRKDFSHCAVAQVLVSVRVGDYGRIKDVGAGKNVANSYFHSFYKTYLVLVNENDDEQLYKKYTNFFLGKLLKEMQRGNFETPLFFLKKMQQKVFYGKPSYKKRFFNLIILTSILKITNLRGYSTLKPYFRFY